MDIKPTILQVLDLVQLGWYVEAYRLHARGATRRAFVDALMACPTMTVEKLLEPLYEVDIKRVCNAAGLSSVGRRRKLIDRLVASARHPTKPAQGVEVVRDDASFVAIDFETADLGRDSACALAVVRVERGRIAHKAVRLIRPPRRSFAFTHIHGITWAQVRNEPDFEEVWRDMRPLVDGVRFIAAHNASFDRGVLKACCDAARMKMPELPFECTVQLARKRWNLYPTKLPNVCTHLGIPLKHHEPGSDAEACARIVLAARE